MIKDPARACAQVVEMVSEQHVVSASGKRIARRIEAQLRSRGQQNLELLYEGLKAYLMLIDPQHFDAKALKAFVTAEWQASLPREVTVEQRKELESHLDRLLALGGVSLPVQPDTQLIASARETIARIPIAQRIYNRLKHQGTGSNLPEFTVAQAGGAQAPLVFTRESGQPLTRGVPGFYSYDGLDNAGKPSLSHIEPTLQNLKVGDWIPMSKTITGAAIRGPSTRKVFVAPRLPLPCSRRSIPRVHLPAR